MPELREQREDNAAAYFERSLCGTKHTAIFHFAYLPLS